MDLYYNFQTLRNIRNLNKHIALDYVRFTPEGISRAELARQLGISRAAVTGIVNDLLAGELVRECSNGTHARGRRPVMLEINPQRGFVIGVDMGASHLLAGLSNFSGRILKEIEEPFDVRVTPEEGLWQVDKIVRRLLADAGYSLSDIVTIGVGIPGPVVAEAGTVTSPPLMPGWEGYPVVEHLQNLWKRPVVLNNDAELGALGEWVFGAGRGLKSLIYVKVGTGVGAGLLLNGQIYRGVTGAAGEFGHTTIVSQGPRCACGNYGCLEALAGGRALAHQAETVVQQGRRTLLASFQTNGGLTARDVAEAARRGDLAAQEIVTQAGNHLGTALASIINLLNPAMVIVGGGVAQMGDLLLQPIRQTIQDRSMKGAAEAVEVTSAVLGRRASLMGAVSQALSLALHQMADGQSNDLQTTNSSSD